MPFALLLIAALFADPLDRTVEVSFRDTPLSDALATLARSAGFEWSYNAALINPAARINYSARNVTVREVLHHLLGEDFSVKSNGNYLIIKRTRKKQRTLSGYIKDPTGQRLANATVYDRRTLRATTTDSTGYYKLKIKSTAEVVVALSGYRDTVIAVTPLSDRFRSVDLSVAPQTVNKRTRLNETLLGAVYQTERFFRVSAARIAQFNVTDSLHRRVQLGVLPRISTNATLSGRVVNDFSFNALAGVSAGVRIIEVSGLGNFTLQSVKGVQAGGLFNINRGDTRGVQLGGLFNRTAGALQGVQAGGLFNTASTFSGAQIAGLFNAADSAHTSALQIAGVANVLRDTEAPALQMAGVVNSASVLKGLQIAGVLNTAREGEGMQMGLINLCRRCDVAQIGLLNWSGGRFFPVFHVRRRKK